MYVVTVVFEIHPQHVEAFRVAMLRQASTSLETEAGCHQFDVASDPQHPNVFFLYELYTDRAAFDAHLDSDHFNGFDQAVTPWVESKTVRLLDRMWPSGA